MPADHPVPKAALLREIRRFQYRIRQARQRRERYVPRSDKRRPKPRPSRPPEELGRLLLLLAERLSQHPSWRQYTYAEDLIAAAMPALLHAAAAFDLSRGTSPFSYLTSTCWREFCKQVAREKSHGMRGLEPKQFPELAHVDLPALERMQYGASGERFAADGW